jgi:hypothetical protein
LIIRELIGPLKGDISLSSKKLLDLVFAFANISLKRDLNAVEKGYFLPHHVIFSQKMKTDGSLCGEKETLLAETNVRPNRDDTIMFCLLRYM